MGIGTNILGYGHPKLTKQFQNTSTWKYEHSELS